jgi:AbrB family looped-hinge helix DNA binding protein
MSFTISIDQAGCLVLPKAILERFNLTGGSKIEIQTVGDHVELKPLIEPNDVALIEKNGRLIIPAPGDATFDAVAEIQRDREVRDSNLR